MAKTIGDLLVEFDSSDRKQWPERVIPFIRNRTAAVPVPPEETEAEKIEAAYQRGLAEGRAAAQAEHDAKTAEEKIRYGIRMTAERQCWVREQGTVLAERITGSFRELENDLAETVSQILEPFLISVLRQRAVSSFTEQLKALWSDRATPVLRINAPADLIEALKNKLGPTAPAIEYVPSDNPEIHMVADHTVI
jgi:hypothetical protein